MDINKVFVVEDDSSEDVLVLNKFLHLAVTLQESTADWCFSYE